MSPPPRAFAPFDFLQLLSIALIWGVNNILAKIAIDALPPMLSMGLRFAIVLALLAVWLRPPPRGKWLLFAAMLACIGPLHVAIQSIGLKLATDMPPMIIAMQLWAPASVLFAGLILGERVSPLRWAGVLWPRTKLLTAFNLHHVYSRVVGHVHLIDRRLFVHQRCALCALAGADHDVRAYF